MKGGIWLKKIACCWENKLLYWELPGKWVSFQQHWNPWWDPCQCAGVVTLPVCRCCDLASVWVLWHCQCAGVVTLPVCRCCDLASVQVLWPCQCVGVVTLPVCRCCDFASMQVLLWPCQCAGVVTLPVCRYCCNLASVQVLLWPCGTRVCDTPAMWSVHCQSNGAPQKWSLLILFAA